jgi:MerR family transcriptional regulator, light-induced transcriptional regulator
MTEQPKRSPTPSRTGAAPHFRSGAVARMAKMPVATLRIWEQRYQAVRPASAASGHRLYSPTDVQRVLLLKQLTTQGHAIGSIAALDSSQLQTIASSSARNANNPSMPAGRKPPKLKVAVVGESMFARLRRPAAILRIGQSIKIIGQFDTLAHAAQSNLPSKPDVLLWLAPDLQPDSLTAALAAQQATGAARIAVAYRFASTKAVDALLEKQAIVTREPADDETLCQWLLAMIESIRTGAPGHSSAEESPMAEADDPGPTMPPRRFDDAALAALAGMPANLVCECPRHLAEILMQLTSFEAYSAGCSSRNPADAAIHQHLLQVAGASRAMFELALERVVVHEGLKLG